MTTEHHDPADVPAGTAIESAVADLEGLATLPVEEHPAVFEAIHRVLRDQLAGTPGVRA